MTGPLGQDSWDRTAGTYSRYRILRIGQSGQDSLDRTVSTGRPDWTEERTEIIGSRTLQGRQESSGQSGLGKAAGTGQLGQDIFDRTSGTGQ